MFTLLLTVVLAGLGHWQTRRFVTSRLRYVDAIQRPVAPLIAGAAAGVLAVILPFIGIPSALIIGLAVGTAVSSGARDIRRRLMAG
jgi:uncharacterized protein (DUF2062 family)